MAMEKKVTEIKLQTNKIRLIGRYMVGCGASAFAMSLTDGPAPVADAIAIGYAIQCGSEC